MKTGILLLAAALSVAGWAQDKGALPLPDSGNVTLPLDDYNRLIELAAKPVKPPDNSPLPFSLKSADLKFQVAGDAATGSIQLEGEVFRKGPSLVPLATGMTILGARQRNAELPLQQSGGTHTAVLPGPGDFSVTLDAGLPLNIEAGRASLVFPVPAAGTARLTLVIPGDHTVVHTTPGLITARSSAGGQTTVEATLVPGKAATIWWAVREAAVQAVPREVRFLSDVKTLVSVSEAELTLTALADIAVVQGDPAQFEIALPAGYEVTGVTGATLDTSDVTGNVLTLRVVNSAVRSHQFLISLTRPNSDPKAAVPVLSLRGTQRETGELLVEGEGTIELTASEEGNLKRIDLKEVSPFLRTLARNSLHAAFRYHRQTGDAPGLSLAWTRFPDSSLLAAVADNAEVTTMVTSAGNSLTEIKLTVLNQSQPFLKVALPAGASIVSAEVAGERVKPVQGADGSRVPLLRAGFRPNGPYQVSFVYMDSGAPFARKGGSELSLPKVDVPIGLVRWEVFLPDRYKVTNFGGDVVAASLMPGEIASHPEPVLSGSLRPGQLGGIVTDPTGAAMLNAQVTVTAVEGGLTRQTRADSAGRWTVANLPPGRFRVIVSSPGFKSYSLLVNYDPASPRVYPIKLNVGTVNETITVSAGVASSGNFPSVDKKQTMKDEAAPASANVFELQKRVAGVLPIAIDVPRAGTSFRFVRPLVVDEETTVTFRYRTK